MQSALPLVRLLVLGPVVGLGLSGCAALGIGGGTSVGSTTTGDGAADGRPSVVAAFYPLAWAAEAVAGRDARVTNLTTPGGEPHDLEIGVAQTARLSDSDLVVYERGFQPAVDAAVEQGAGADALDVDPLVDLQPYTDDHGRAESEAEVHAHDGAEQQTSDTTLGNLNPHFWQDPLRMAAVTDAVARRLADLDPAHAEAYRARAQRVRGELEALDQAYASGLSSCRRETVVVNHDAFGYLAKYGLRFDPVTGFSPDAEPTPGDLARLQRLIESEGITTVFYETLVSPRTAEVLASDTGTRAAVLDPIEGLTSATADQDYLSLMRRNLAALERANAC